MEAASATASSPCTSRLFGRNWKTWATRPPGTYIICASLQKSTSGCFDERSAYGGSMNRRSISSWLNCAKSAVPVIVVLDLDYDCGSGSYAMLAWSHRRPHRSQAVHHNV